MDFRILGPLEVVDDGRRLPIGQGRESALLALLLLRANEVIAADVLIEELWRGEPPATGAKSLQVYVSRLRKRVGADVIATRACRATACVSVATSSTSSGSSGSSRRRTGVEGPEAAAATLRDALSLWRGAPLAEFANEAWAQPEIGRLEELRLAALEDRIDADLALGRHADVVGELELLVSGNPYRERLCGQLMSEAARRPCRTPGASPRGRHRHGGCGAREIGTAGSDRRAESVALIDPARNRVVDAIRVADRPTRIAVRGNAVWVLHPDIRTLTLVDRAERKVLRTVGLGARQARLPSTTTACGSRTPEQEISSSSTPNG